MKTGEELENRMVAAHAVGPTPAAHCGHCFGEGRNAALHVLEHAVGDLVERLKAAHETGALPGMDVHCGHCFVEGREAALRVVMEEPAEPVPPVAGTKPVERPGVEPTPPIAGTKPGEGPAAKPVHLPKT
jgi:hypothetical protein